MTQVKVIPKCQRAKNRIKEHGNTMFLEKRGMFGGEDAFLLRSIDNTWDGNKWLGWLTVSEVDIKEETVEKVAQQPLKCTSIQLWEPPPVRAPEKRFDRWRRWLVNMARKISRLIISRLDN